MIIKFDGQLGFRRLRVPNFHIMERNSKWMDAPVVICVTESSYNDDPYAENDNNRYFDSITGEQILSTEQKADKYVYEYYKSKPIGKIDRDKLWEEVVELESKNLHPFFTNDKIIMYCITICLKINAYGTTRITRSKGRYWYCENAKW